MMMTIGINLQPDSKLEMLGAGLLDSMFARHNPGLPLLAGIKFKALPPIVKAIIA